ncbi:MULTISPECIES: hypothetical protein [Acinetobacter calcoaceticus/baumannii complex]|uniref:hypothetical protein n=1 Tax=Acinetobacter calcoaceticus/baumannii complex TaxID=909768 RepID=UPI00028CF4BA|nr:MULTISPECIES: hypothetical protein [Acinetobacter calcoaceticus/baumannii complex]KCX93101.1 hypothetical protein J568_1978 [Acinetobacter baumannii 6112]UUG68538.1 hypothetical protein [Acinetobacter phage TCUAN1]EHU1208328.1 hypothetical protein [Acinetobacter nosocomialis]EKF47545.1 hypothetical protein W9I_00019 [Acinetobacter nosocomialis Ab22222]MBR7714420.1 hypothetical protein [Acinetobacter nosocomialis]
MTIVKLRAFEIINSDIKKKQSDIGDKLRVKLQNSAAVHDRRMLLNAEDPQKEEDLISDFAKNSSTGDPVFCTMLRVALGNNVQHIDNTLFSKKNFTISELNSNVVNAEAIYKNHYYFAVNNNFLITNMPGNLTITRLQTYLNWLLNELYEVNPLIAEDAMPELSNIKDIIVKDPVAGNSITPVAGKPTFGKSFNIGKAALDLVRHALTDAKDISDHQLEQMISAKLVIEFKKPKKDDDEQMRKAFGALLKPVSDLDNFEFMTRNNKKIIKGKKILRVKDVTIETTDSKLLNEAQLSQEMNKLIRELENERQKATV